MRQRTLLLSILLLACTEDKDLTCPDLPSTWTFTDAPLKDPDLKEVYVDMLIQDLYKKPSFPPTSYIQFRPTDYERSFKFCGSDENLNKLYGPSFCYNVPWFAADKPLKAKYWGVLDESPLYPKYCFDMIEGAQVIHEWVICYGL